MLHALSASRGLRRGLTVLGVLALLWLVVSRSLVAYLAMAWPDAALKLDADAPAALVAKVEARLKAHAANASEGGTGDGAASGARSAAASGAERQRLEAFARPGVDVRPGTAPSLTGPPPHAPSPAELDELRSLLARALTRDPLNARALTLLGTVAGFGAESPAAALEASRPYYERAARLTLRETGAILQLMLAAIARGEYDAAVRHADTLLRTRIHVQATVLPILARLAEVPEAADAVKRAVTASPPPHWRTRFLAILPEHTASPATPLDVLLAVKQSPTPPTPAEQRPYLSLLIRKGEYQLAYYAWLQLLPPEALSTLGLVFNGGFEATPTGLPFDWTISAGSGVTAEVAPLPGEGGRQGLRIDFAGERAHLGGITQTLVLAPGSYTLSGHIRGELSARRGVRWRVVCLAAGAPRLAETPMYEGTIPGWRRFEMGFRVPDTGCPAQVLRLDHDARSASERLAAGTLWFNDVRIVRERSGSATR